MSKLGHSYQPTMDAFELQRAIENGDDELEPGQVFRTHTGDIVKLDRRVPGDGTDWYVADWWNDAFANMDTRIHPSDLAERIPEPEEPA